ncbi:MAG: hypothetical protein ACTSPB_21610 [Candidatus Thorarchaeota archaeon]
MIEEKKYVRYVKTTRYSKVVKNLNDEQILFIEGKRNWTTTPGDSCPPDCKYLSYKNVDKAEVKLSYSSLFHGGYSKNLVADFFMSHDIQDIVIGKIDLLIPDEVSKKVAREAAFITSNPSIEKYSNWVLSLVENPLRREPRNPLTGDVEQNEYTLSVKEEFSKSNDAELGFEPASLDFDIILPLEIWREITRSRKISKTYHDSIERWRGTRSNALIRTAVKEVFPKDLTSGREYIFRPRKGWILISHGDI